MGISRRSMLKSAFAGGTSLLTFSQLFNYNNVFGQSTGDDVETIVNLATTAELIATTHYYTVLTESDIALTPEETNILMGFLDAELQHLEILYANSGLPLATRFYIPSGVYNDREQFSEITEQLETTFIGAYLAATRQFAELGFPLLAGTAAQVGAIEQEHLAIVRAIGGRRPNNVALARALYYNISEAVPGLQPFIEGGEGYEGPIDYPSADAIRDLIRDAGVVNTAPFTDASVFPQAAAAAAAGCTVMPGGNYNCNLRSGPGLNYPVVGRLAPGETLAVDGQTTDTDGFPWWRSTLGDQWVRSDIVVSTEGECSTLPVITKQA